MTMENRDASKELQARAKSGLFPAAEQTRPGLVFTPSVDIYETEGEITLLADMPGVKSENVSIDLKEDTLTLTGEIEPFEGAGEEDLMIEYEVGQYQRQFYIPELIDRENIDAQLNEGVLKLVLPKAEKAKPKKIQIKTE
ncbi:MAG: Hsp20/alpha crystallin family protein [Thermodesulfobacteriota bacterium]